MTEAPPTNQPPSDCATPSTTPSPPHQHATANRQGSHAGVTHSVLAMPAWLRVAAVLPVIMALWLAVWWANEGAAWW